MRRPISLTLRRFSILFNTGPPYPRPPTFGGNETGVNFAIGKSQIGDLPLFDVWTTVLSQYANSPTLTTMLVNYARAADQTENLNNFFDFIWSVVTAQGYGLDVWGRIVGVNRIIQVWRKGEDYFGFDQAVPGVQSWNLGLGAGGAFLGGVLYSGNALTSAFSLSDTAFRQLILAKAAANVSNGSIRSQVNSIRTAAYSQVAVTHTSQTTFAAIDSYFGLQAANDTVTSGFGQAPSLFGHKTQSASCVGSHTCLISR